MKNIINKTGLTDLKYITITEKDRENIERFEEDMHFLERNEDKLKEKYPNKWIGILNKKVVGVNDDFDNLLLDIRSKDIDTGKAVIEFLSTGEDIWIL